MIELDIPGWGRRQLQHLLLDLNGTLALDGKLIEGVADRLAELSLRLRLHLVTADTFKTAATAMSNLECQPHLLGPCAQDQEKMELARKLGPLACVGLGNGRNDKLMLQECALGIGVIGPEGACAELLGAADVICSRIQDALDLLLHPQRLTATLRC